MNRIYWNIRRKTFSLQAKVDGRWRVIGHLRQGVVKNAAFKVYESGRLKCLETGQKNVHAYVMGELINSAFILPSDDSSLVKYNPYRDTSFMKDGTRIDNSEEVWFWTSSDNKPMVFAR